MSRLLREAAALTKQPTLKSFLEKRADAFMSNDYYASDVAWMELDASIEPTIGPYEVYEDEWFNFKAAFEAFITLTDRDESAKLERFSSELQDLENHLPIDPQFRRAKLGGYSPIRVVNVVFAAGDGNHGVQTAAFNLPNDEKRRRREGLQARAAEELPAGEVREGAGADRGQSRSAADRPAGVAFELVLHAHPDARADARTRTADHQGRRPRDDRAAGTERAERPARGSEGGHLRAVGVAVPDGQGRHRQEAGTQHVRDVPRFDVPHAAVRPERGARQGHGAAGELPAGPRRHSHRQGRAVLARPARRRRKPLPG